MQHFADSAAREKRQREEREEPQLSLAEPCLADHVQLGCPEHVQLGSPEHVLLFRDALEPVRVCREARNKLKRIFRQKNATWCKQEAHQLASAHAQLDQAFAKAEALSEGIQLELLTPCVHDYQWQPASDRERKREFNNKRLATAAITQSSASASWHSTPAKRPHPGGTLQYELKILGSSTTVQPTYVKTPEQIERTKAVKAETAEKSRHDATDPPYHPGCDFRPDDAQLREHCVSKVHSRGARQCFDMCLVPCTNAAFSVELVAIPGDVAYLKALQDFVAGDDVLQARHVVYYHNRTLSDHKITLIKSW